MKYFCTVSLPFLMLSCLLAAAVAQDTQTPQPTALTAGSATIDEIKGEVSVQAPQSAPAKAQPGQVLAAETIIETHKGSALLHLEDGSQVLVKPRSRVVLKSPTTGSGSFFELLLGKILAKVQKRLGNAPSFRMGTPTAVVTVRGTRFEVDVDKKGNTYVEVFEGIVQVASLIAPQSPVTLQPGYRTWVAPDKLPRQPQSEQEYWNQREREMNSPENELGRPNSPGETERNAPNQSNQQEPPEPN